MNWVDWLLIVVAGYAALGVLFAVPFLVRGIAVVDPAAGSARSVRVLFLPGTIALWPLLLARWRRAAVSDSGTDGRNAP